MGERKHSLSQRVRVQDRINQKNMQTHNQSLTKSRPEKILKTAGENDNIQGEYGFIS